MTGRKDVAGGVYVIEYINLQYAPNVVRNFSWDNMDNYTQTNIYLSFLIHQLYGDKDYRSIKGSLNVKELKKYYLKIWTTIRLSITETITTTDNAHRQELLNSIKRNEETITLAKTFDDLDQIMVTTQTELIFRLIGHLPKNYRAKRVLNKKGGWALNFLRQIQYTQSIEQKKNAIFKAVKEKYEDRFGDWGDFVTNVYYKECNDDPEKLIGWIKQNHPDIYLDLF